MKIAIILPAYNEEMTIQRTIESFYQECPKARIVVVNNNSMDSTATIAEETFRRLGAFGEVIRETCQGKGNAVRRAFMEINADIYVISDADCTYPANRIHDLMAPVIDGLADMVTGDRHSKGNYEKENKRPLHNFGNKLVQSLVNGLFGASLADIMTGYRCFSRSFVKNYPILVKGFEIETDMTLHALDKKFRIMEVPVEYIDRPMGSFSKLNTLSDGALVLNTIVRILRFYRPMYFFGGLSLCFAFLGVIASIPVLDDWIRYRYIYHVPLAILSTGIEIIALLLIAIALILDSIADQDKRNFELRILNSQTH
jgi:glycosyltransferase involved in cell wall biosynthesis